MNIANYSMATLSAPEALVGANGEVWLPVYNNTGGALSNGAIKELSYLVDTGTVNAAASASAPMILIVPKAPATSAGEITVIGVIDNSVLNEDTIADGKIGYAKVSGVVQALVNGTADVAIGDQLEVLNGGSGFIVAASASSGASGLIVPECVAIALEAYTTGSDALKYVHLIGRKNIVKAA
jgi:hypothetical protein